MVGEIFEQDNLIDEVVVTLFKGPKSYTGEDIIEIACHGSTYIQTKIIQLLIKKGCRLAKNGEFTLRAFLNQKLDLSQAEGVAELIASENEKAHSLAMQQMKGGLVSVRAEMRLLVMIPLSTFQPNSGAVRPLFKKRLLRNRANSEPS